MDDEKIIELYFQRSEHAIKASREKYGRYCYSIAFRMLFNEIDTEDCVSETWLRAWQAIPPEKPRTLKAFFAKITRNLALNRLDYNNAQKRKLEISSIIDEFWECVADTGVGLEDEIVMREAVNGFLKSLDTRTRVIFMRRYFYGMSIEKIAKSTSLSYTNVTVILMRTRSKFKEYLKKEGVIL